jgi:hypothetical protein
MAAPATGSTQCQACPATTASNARPALSQASNLDTSTSSPCRRARSAIRASGSTPSTRQPTAWNCRATMPGPVVAVGIRAERLGYLAALMGFPSAELAEDRIARIGAQAAALLESAGTGTVAGNLTSVLTGLFSSVAVAIVALITFRDDLRARLRATTPRGVPLLTEAGAMIASYLTAERDLGRVAADADIGTLAPTLLGASHLLFADRAGAAPEPEAVRKVVTTVIAGVIRDDIPGPVKGG